MNHRAGSLVVCVTSNYTALLMINEISGVKETEYRAFKLKGPAFAEDSGNYGREYLKSEKWL